MKEILLKINENGTGMHARPASVFVNCASKFPCDIIVIKEDVEVNGKSIMGLMMLALAPGNEFRIQASGEKEDEALEALTNIVNNDFV
ncbi:HPr family phosphocarrier protein [Leptospira gomenensis]|uniref:HPr family phosphocarrier protein n=1 Tax=Leptospira gomenensis TaxID=2484974 RepID=A0A5F1YC86_9LEPT|nr:HPr family phosphocarrier protein [Leptospira gomenensis]TGK35045.1 HPr family phosphocarrier protein [Leptospira gomenensis]TGK35277.1 HPr family phosphocarrier protein [Leptospira gomenensis]TGK51762.1 HPr family phosphocarrier protein [Leptospira gomenensis]TGK58357.1 HPr family phosphocarrier protein [Leptospira gomenensis]